MAEQLKLKVGGRYLTRGGRVTTIEKRSGNDRFCFVGRVEGDDLERGWTESGQWGYYPGETLDLVSEYVEPAAANEPRYRYFRYAEPDHDPHHTCVWRHAAGDRYCTAKYIYRGNDDWEDTGICLEDNLSDPDMVECDENWVPLDTQPAADEFLVGAETLDELEALRRWKEEAMIVLGEIDLQAISKEMDLPLGSNIGPKILPFIRDLKSRIRNGGTR